MRSVTHRIHVDAPRDRVFDLARHVEAHVETMPDEEALAGTGLLEQGDRVTFRAAQFGVPFALTAEVVASDPPHFFRDEGTARVAVGSGAGDGGPSVAQLTHAHSFLREEGQTVMCDEVSVSVPFGPLGRVAEPVVARRLDHLLDHRARELRRLAEGDGWQRFLE